MPTIVNINGEIFPPEEARVSVFDRGFLYGDSVYETLRVNGGQCWLLALHLERLEHSAERLAIRLPLTRRDLAAEVERTLDAAGLTDAALRISVTRGAGPIGIRSTTGERPTLVIIVRPLEPLPASAVRDGVPVVIARTVRNSPRALDPNIKSGNFLNNILGAQEAERRGAFEALMLNHEGNLTEGTQSNVFLVSDGALVTPDPSAGILRGITRDLVLRLARAAGIACEERSVFVAELIDAEELFLTSTLKGVLPATQLNGRPVGAGVVGPMTARVRDLVEDERQRFIRGARER